MGEGNKGTYLRRFLWELNNAWKALLVESLTHNKSSKKIAAIILLLWKFIW